MARMAWGCALLALTLAVLARSGEARFLRVGNYSSPDNCWTNYWDYAQWAEENPLYEGDTLVFTYHEYQHVVWELPSKLALDACVYDNALFTGNDTAGLGLGFWITAEKKPRYFACGVFGHCEEFGQAVVIQATLGPLPPNPKKAPAEIPDPRRYQPSPPPASPPPPAIPSPPPPPPATGFLAEVFDFNPKTKDYSTFYSLIAGYAQEIEAAAKQTPITILAPTNEAIMLMQPAIDVGVSFQPDYDSKQYFLKQLVTFHMIPQYIKGSELQGLTGPLDTLIKGETLQFNPASNSFYSVKSVSYGNGTVIETDLQVKAGVTGDSTISIMGISAVLFPADLSSLVDPTARDRYVYGTDPPFLAPPKNANMSEINAYVKKLEESSDLLSNSKSFFTNSTLILNNTHYNLWPYISWLPYGATVIVPTDAAWGLPMPTLLMDMLTLIPEASQVAWTANLGAYMVLLTPYISDQWQLVSRGTGFPTALPGALVFFVFQGGLTTWYPNADNLLYNASNPNWVDMQIPGDFQVTIEGTENVLVPRNATRLLPPSLIPTGPNPNAPPTPSPAVPPVASPPMESPPVESPPTESPPVESPPMESPPVESPPIVSPPVETPPPGPLAPSGPPDMSVSCSVVSSWESNGQKSSQYNCNLVNKGSSAASHVKLTCTNFNPTTAWNINSDCSMPTVVAPGQTWTFGFITSGAEPSFSINTFTGAGSVTVGPGPSSSPVSLQCSSVTGWPQGQDWMVQYSCTVTNSGPATVSSVALTCTDFKPSSKWNINDDCTLPQAIQPGQSWSFGFQIIGSATLAIASSSEVPGAVSPSQGTPAAPAGLEPAAAVAPPPVTGTTRSGVSLSLTCTTEGSWSSGNQQVQQQQCVLTNSGSVPAGDVVLECTNFQPTIKWNINSDCSIPTTVYPAENWTFGYQTTAGPATFTVKSYKALSSR